MQVLRVHGNGACGFLVATSEKKRAPERGGKLKRYPIERTKAADSELLDSVGG